MRHTDLIVTHGLIAVSMGLGGGALLLLGVFWFVGSWQFWDFGWTPTMTLIWDAGLAVVFSLQHSAMVRIGFRRRLGAFLPETYHGWFYAVTSGIFLLLVLALWQTSSTVVWSFDGLPRIGIRIVDALAVWGFSWGTGALESMDAFGQRSILDRIRGRSSQASSLRIRGPYRWVRHPLYFFVLVLLWACPTCTADRLVLNVVWTIWIVIGSLLEERDLAAEFGAAYRAYQVNVPMLIPRPPRA